VKRISGPWANEESESAPFGDTCSTQPERTSRRATRLAGRLLGTSTCCDTSWFYRQVGAALICAHARNVQWFLSLVRGPGAYSTAREPIPVGRSCGPTRIGCTDCPMVGALQARSFAISIENRAHSSESSRFNCRARRSIEDRVRGRVACSTWDPVKCSVEAADPRRTNS